MSRWEMTQKVRVASSPGITAAMLGLWPQGTRAIRGVYFAGFGKSHGREQNFELVGFFPLAGAAIVRAEGGDGREPALQVDDGVALVVQERKQGIRHKGSGRLL